MADVIVLDPMNCGGIKMSEIAEILKKRKLQISINVSEKLWGYVIPYMAQIPIRIGFDPGYTQPLKSIVWVKLLTDRVGYPNDPTRRSGEHEVERHNRLLHPLGIRSQPGALQIHLDEDDRRWAAGLISSRGSKSPAAIHLSAKWLQDGWGEEELRGIILAMAKDQDSTILITYGETEKAWAEGFLEGLRCSNVLPFYDPYFRRWAAVLSQAGVLITMDTSASHVASAVGVPVVDIFSERYFAHTTERWHPWKVDYRLVERKSLGEIQDPGDRESVVTAFRQQILQYLGELRR